MLAKDAVRPILRRVPGPSYARGQVNALIAGVRHELEPLPADRYALDHWRKLAPLDPGPAAAPLTTTVFGYKRSDVEFWRRALAGTLGAVPVRSLAAQVGLTVASLLAAAAVLAAIDPAALAVALAAYLVIATPILGRRRYRTAAYQLRVAPERQAAMMLASTLTKWSFVGVLAILGAATDLGRSAIYLVAPHFDSDTGTSFVVAIVFLVPSFFMLYRLGNKAPYDTPAIAWQLRHFAVLLPRTSADRAVFAFMAVTAGVVEELVYRGFGIAFVAWALPGATNLQLVWFTAAAFGIAHVYQSVFGAITTMLIGAYLAWLTLATGSLVPAMILHILIDARFCLIPANYVEAL